MCDPVTLAATATAVTTIGGVYKGLGDASLQRHQAGVAETNVVYAEREITDARDRGGREQLDQGRRVAALRGQQTAMMAGQGLDVAFGSPLDLIADTDAQGLEDQQTIRTNSLRQVEGLMIDAANSRAQARMLKAGARNTMISTAFEAGGTLLSGATQTMGYMGKFGAPKWTGSVGRSMEQRWPRVRR
jgi:hypothetical protein